MPDLSPAQRTAGTARFLMAAGAIAAVEALVRGSVARIVMATVVLLLGGGLLAYAKRAH